MTDYTVYQLGKMLNEMDAEVREELERHTDEELGELVRTHMAEPEAVLRAALLSGCASKLVTMAALPIQRERIRRAEVRAMEGPVYDY